MPPKRNKTDDGLLQASLLAYLPKPVTPTAFTAEGAAARDSAAKAVRAGTTSTQPQPTAGATAPTDDYDTDDEDDNQGAAASNSDPGKQKTRKKHSVDVIGEMLFAVEVKGSTQADVLLAYPGVSATTLSTWVCKLRKDNAERLKLALPGVSVDAKRWVEKPVFLAYISELFRDRRGDNGRVISAEVKEKLHLYFLAARGKVCVYQRNRAVRHNSNNLPGDQRFNGGPQATDSSSRQGV
jgi:hypothetical protein